MSQKGVVVKGRGKGKALGCPTANLDVAPPANLENGIYFASTIFRGKVYPSVANIGITPYDPREQRLLEVHLLCDFEEDFYGEQLEVDLLKRHREERNFSSETDLKNAIQKDIDEARAYFESCK